jgi:hypothetical protein
MEEGRGLGEDGGGGWVRDGEGRSLGEGWGRAGGWVRDGGGGC